MAIRVEKDHKTKTSFYIDSDNKEKMKKLVSKRKQTEFINKAVREALIREEKQKMKNKAIRSIENCPTFKVDKPSEEIVREIRENRINHLSKILDN